MARLTVRIFSLALFIGLVSPAWGATYYVSKTGSNMNACTAGTDSAGTNKLTITAGIGCLNAAGGDTLIIHAGTYTEGLTYNIWPTGADEAHRTFVFAANGDTVTINGSEGLLGAVVVIYYSAYITIGGQQSGTRNLIIDGTNITYNAVFFTGGDVGNGWANHITLQHAVVKTLHVGGSACITSGGPTGVEVNNLIYNDLDVNTCDMANGGSTPTPHCIYAHADTVTIQNSDLHACQDYGVQAYNGGLATSTNIIVKNNKIHDNGDSNNNNPGGGIVCADTSAMEMYNNLIYHNGKQSGGSSTSSGINLYNGCDGALIYNNTIYGNLSSIGLWNQNGTNAVDRNNISFSNDSGQFSGTFATSDHRLSTDPTFVNAAGNDFHIQSTSAARDTGATISLVTVDFDGNVRPQGCCYDIGAYEFVSASAPHYNHWKEYLLPTPGTTLTNKTIMWCANLTLGNGNVCPTLAALKTTGNGGDVTCSTGCDIGFGTNGDSNCGTKYSWDPLEQYTASSGAIIAWIGPYTQSSGGGNILWVCWGDSGTTTFQGGGAGAAWDSHTQGVWHLSDVPTTANDSSSHSRNGTVNGATAGTGQTDGGASYNGSTNYIGSVGAVADFSFVQNTGVFSVTLWGKFASRATSQMYVGNADGAPDKGFYVLFVSTTGQLYSTLLNGSAITVEGHTAVNTINDANWHCIAVTGDDTNLDFYVDGSQKTTTYDVAWTTLSTGNSTRAMNFGIDAFDNASFPFNGIEDEIEIADAARSSDWILQQCNNQSAPSTFFTAAGTPASSSGFLSQQAAP